MATKTNVAKLAADVAETADIAALFGEVELESARVRNSRQKVDVPAEVLKTLKEATANGKRAIWPVRDANHFDAMADVLYSAGELLNASVVGAPVKKTDNGYQVVKKDEKEWTATHVRVTVGKRRGRKSHDTAS